MREASHQRIDDHTFGNQNSKRDLADAEDAQKGAVSEAGFGRAVGQENTIIRPSGSKSSLKQEKEDQSPSQVGQDDLGSATMAHANTGIQSDFTGQLKVDSQQPS